MNSVEFTLQVLSVILTAFSVVVAVGSIDIRWSLAAVIARKWCGRERIDWQAQRHRWRGLYPVDLESQPCSCRVVTYSVSPDVPIRTQTGLSDFTIVAQEGHTVVGPENSEDNDGPFLPAILAQNHAQPHIELAARGTFTEEIVPEENIQPNLPKAWMKSEITIFPDLKVHVHGTNAVAPAYRQTHKARRRGGGRNATKMDTDFEKVTGIQDV